MTKYALLLLLACFGYSCITPEPINEEPVKEKILIPISIENEVIVGQSSAQFLAEQITSDDLCAISVYTTNDKPYAYGMFDLPNIPPIEMLTGDVYKVVCTVVKNGKNVIHQDDKGYHNPFKIAGKPTPITNKFQYNNVTAIFNDLLKGIATISDGKLGKLVDYPLIDRYSGVLSDFTATANSQISLELKRAVFGLIPTTEGLKSGHIAIALNSSLNTIITLHPQDEAKPAAEYVFSMANKLGTDAILSTDYTETIKLHIKRYDKDGISTSLTPTNGVPITVKRKSTYPITIKIQENASNVITFEDATLKKEDPIIIQ